MSATSIFFNQSFDKKKLKAFIYWVYKTFGEKKALTIIEELKGMGFYNATKAGLSIGLHDLKTPSNKKILISRAQVLMNKTDREFQGAELTATERSQRIIDTWHRTSEELRKQVVDYFSTYDQLNSVYMMALSGARGNFSQVRQLIGMRGLMADPQGQIISFPIRSNLREGLTLTEYFISCSGARKGLVDTALRTADTGYLTRRLVDISHHIVVKKVTCYTSRGIALKSLQTSQKILLPLKDRLVGRVLGENIYSINQPEDIFDTLPITRLHPQSTNEPCNKSNTLIAKKNQEISPALALQISLVKLSKIKIPYTYTKEGGSADSLQKYSSENTVLQVGAKQNSEQVLVRSPLTCAYTHEVCQLCYGWSMAQGSLVSLGEAVGVIAGQSIGEPGTQLTMRTFHTGGVFSGDLLQEIRAPHSGKIVFPKALQGLLIRTSQGRIAFLIKVSGELLLDTVHVTEEAKHSTEQQGANKKEGRKTTRLSLEPSTILFVRQGEKVKNNQLLAELAITTQEGNQPIKSRQTLFSEMSGKIVQWKSLLSKMHRTKGVSRGQNGSEDSPLFLLKYHDEERNALFDCKSSFSKNDTGKEAKLRFASENVNDLTLKEIVQTKKHGFGGIEPPKALKLGLCTVIATRIGASKKTITKLATNSQTSTRQLSEYNFLRRKELYKTPMHNLYAKPSFKMLRYQKQSAMKKLCCANKAIALGNKAIAKAPLLQSLCSALLLQPLCSQKLRFCTTRKNFARSVKKQSFIQPGKEFTQKIHNLSHLNTIAKEGDLVDENYSKI